MRVKLLSFKTFSFLQILSPEDTLMMTALLVPFSTPPQCVRTLNNKYDSQEVKDYENTGKSPNFRHFPNREISQKVAKKGW